MILNCFQVSLGSLLFVIPVFSVAFSVDSKVEDVLVGKQLTNLDIETLGGEAGSKSRKWAWNDKPVTSQPHLVTARSISDETLNIVKQRAEAPSFTYCQAEEGTPQKRADDTVPGGTKGCGCLPFTKVLWHGVVFGVGKAIEGLGKCLEGCCNCSFCGARVGAAEAGAGALGGGLGGGGLGAAQGQAMGAAGGAVGRRIRRADGNSVSARDSRLTSLVPDALQHAYLAERAGPIEFAYCLAANKPVKHKRANDAAAATRGCGCVPFTKTLWQGVVLGTKSLGSILGRCLSPCRSCLHGCCMAEGIQGGGAAGSVNGGAAAAAAAVSNPAAGRRRSLLKNKEGHDVISSLLSLSARSKTPPTTPPTYTYCLPTLPPKDHNKRATNDPLPTTNRGSTTTNTECNCIKTAWQALVLGATFVGELFSYCIGSCGNCLMNWGEGVVQLPAAAGEVGETAGGAVGAADSAASRATGVRVRRGFDGRRGFGGRREVGY